jgi:sigma-B regulation protein RsbU (phosphoserine phosphatase)
MPKPLILLLDDDPAMLDAVSLDLNLAFDVICASTIQDGVDKINVARGAIEVAVIDMWIGADQEGGLQAINQIRALDAPPECIVLTAHGTQTNIIKCMESGAYSYVEKSGRMADDSTGLLITAIKRAMETHHLKQLEAAQEQIKAEERIKQDMERAYEIQMSMLPQQDLKHEGIHLSGYCQPADNVGGDYYDYFVLPDGRIGVLIGDVTGHGFYAGLVVAMARSCRTTQTNINPEVEPVMSAINQIVQITGPDWLFMTVCYVLIDPINHTYSYANGGHHFPFHYHAASKEAHPLESTGTLLGILPDMAYPAVERTWASGDLLVLYSDGITEAENAQGELFGEAKLQQLIHAHAHLSPPDLKHTIIQAVEAFCQGVPQRDDVTLVVGKL